MGAFFLPIYIIATIIRIVEFERREKNADSIDIDFMCYVLRQF